MKRTILFILLCTAAARAGAQTVEINSLYVPTAPGFVLMDKAPALVERPVDPKAFGIDVLNLFEGGAIQTTPYWLVNHPAYTFDDYLARRFPLIETFNISGATTSNDSTSSLSFGARCQVFRFFSKKQRDEIAGIKQEIIGLLVTLPIDEKAIDEKKQELAHLKAKPAVNIELAGAIAGLADNKAYDNISLNRSGVWLNVHANPYHNAPFDFTGVARYTWSAYNTAAAASDSAFADVGAALSTGSELFDLSCEYVYRSDISANTAYHRLALVGNYMLSKNIVVVASLGKDFNNIQNIFGVFGVKFGLSTEKASLN